MLKKFLIIYVSEFSELKINYDCHYKSEKEKVFINAKDFKTKTDRLILDWINANAFIRRIRDHTEQDRGIN